MLWSPTYKLKFRLIDQMVQNFINAESYRLFDTCRLVLDLVILILERDLNTVTYLHDDDEFNRSTSSKVRPGQTDT